jgi:DeoR/GlpR family transcriptional regulator of sugar metabolism
VFESDVTYRRQLAVAEKRAIAGAAAALLQPGMSVLLEDSTTTLALAELAADLDPLTVITNVAPIIQLMMGRTAPHRVAELTDFERDAGAPAAALEALAEQRIEVTVADPVSTMLDR